MYTSIIGVALSAVLGTATASSAPAWQHDYRLARELGELEHKPLVVVIGSGSTPWAKLARATEQDGTINPTLRNHYVCLFVDTDTADGKKLAQSFAMDGPGLVISDRTGEVQAFRRTGEVPTTELAQTLNTHADDVYVARKLAVPAAPAAQPVHYQPTQFVSPVFGGFGGAACRT
jgi:hypothetical protein